MSQVDPVQKYELDTVRRVIVEDGTPRMILRNTASLASAHLNIPIRLATVWRSASINKFG